MRAFSSSGGFLCPSLLALENGWLKPWLKMVKPMKGLQYSILNCFKRRQSLFLSGGSAFFDDFFQKFRSEFLSLVSISFFACDNLTLAKLWTIRLLSSIVLLRKLTHLVMLFFLDQLSRGSASFSFASRKYPSMQKSRPTVFLDLSILSFSMSFIVRYSKTKATPRPLSFSFWTFGGTLFPPRGTLSLVCGWSRTVFHKASEKKVQLTFSWSKNFLTAQAYSSKTLQLWQSLRLFKKVIDFALNELFFENTSPKLFFRKRTKRISSLRIFPELILVWITVNLEQIQIKAI